MNKITWSIGVLGGAVAISLVVLLLAMTQESSVTSFEECVEAGNPVMESYPRQCQSSTGEVFTETIDEVVGTVSAIDASQIAVDGPTEITLDTEDGETVAAVPSMGINLCPATDAIVDVSTLEVGDTVAVRGRADSQGRLVPCESESHYLELRQQSQATSSSVQ